MEREHFERSSGAARAARLVAAALVITGATSAWARTETGALGVGLRIVASCQVDSAAVVGAVHLARLPRPDVSCEFVTPRAVRVTREPSPEAQGADPSVGAAGPGSTVVVTLTF